MAEAENMSAYDQIQFGDEQLKYLRSIDATTKQILTHASGMSQSDARNYRGSQQRGFSAEYQNVSRRGGRSGFGSNRRAFGNISDEFTDAFEEALFEGFLGSDFKKKVGQAINAFADGLGVQIEDIPKTLGKELGRQAMSAFKQSNFGKAFTEKLDSLKNKIFSEAKERFKQGAQGYDRAYGTDFWSKFSQSYAKQAAGQTAQGAEAASAAAKSAEAASTVASNTTAIVEGGGAIDFGVFASSASNAGAGLAGIAEAAAPLIASMGTMLVVLAAVYVAIKILGPAIEDTVKLFKELGKAANRDKESRKKNLEYEKERLAADVKSLIEAPFTILTDAANRVYDAWDKNVRLINQTQGYSKADLQDLMAAYAERLRSENLASVIGSTDIINNLSKVIEAGLSGAAAEEFAYVATVLNAAVPTQDFFSYAEQYASVAANAIANGKSQSEALAEANLQIKSFASNILYASRELTGGFTTGLKDASSLFKDAVIISQTARTGNASQISGVLASVSAVVGAIAPDLVSETVGSITKAATGGNVSELVALRSMAGINASNTEFLKRFAADPQGVFAAVFSGLAQKQKLAPGAYMEVAEGLSSIFGLSIDALARVDFEYLADAIRSMNVNNASLDENMRMLTSGESTTNSELHRLAQINEYMVNEGLALVLDNEVGRSIQEHMWQEQMKRELMEAEYGVNLHGAALEFLEGIKNTVNNVLAFLNPFGWLFNKVANVIQTAAEARSQESDIRQVLTLGAVGSGNLRSLYQLTTRNQDLNLTRSYISMLGGVSLYETVHTIGQIAHDLRDVNRGTTIGDMRGAGRNFIRSAFITGVTSGMSLLNEAGLSKYSWGSLGKRQASAIAAIASNEVGALGSSSIIRSSIQSPASRFNEMLDAMSQMASEGKSYADWVATASKYNIADVAAAAEEAGYTESQLQDMFGGQSSKAAGEREAARKEREEDFWKSTTAHLVLVNDHLNHLDKGFTKFWEAWQDYFIRHTVYNEALNLDQAKIAKIRSDENSELSDSVYELARAFLGADFKDPQIQTNALLSQILMVLNAIMQQGDRPSESTGLFDTFAALATGLYGSR